MPPVTLQAIIASIAAISLTACQSVPQSTSAITVSAYAPETPQLSCAPHGNPNGSPAKLTANRTRIGDPAYIEFRQRFSPGIPSGHLYVVFGRLDAKGNPVTRLYTGLFPKGSLAGLYAGAIVPMPSDLMPSYADCHLTPNAAYRVSLTESQYQQLLGKVQEDLANPPMWRMFGYNCNNYAASLGSVAGLVEPANRAQPSFSYIYAYIDANGDGSKKSAS
ncbi:hypothetical protein J2X72_003246 [Phyllobacterium sp. 1468]|uniref:hypothetical protein n=1 Tax=Phyllobacterium sp. 1468 TaxID=2817759 RepID=UPI0028557F74|nr:hypothetical protein [Phyllobacterium sp. 1468]MDR6634436.1 hypothetical protein [Phyllobacterium sp. 1468]